MYGLDCETPGELCQYPTTQRELYGEKYMNQLKFFMSTVLCHTFSKLFSALHR